MEPNPYEAPRESNVKPIRSDAWILLAIAPLLFIGGVLGVVASFSLRLIGASVVFSGMVVMSFVMVAAFFVSVRPRSR